MTTRRDLMKQGVAAAIGLGLPPDLYARISARPGPRPNLEVALKAARWIARSRQITEHGLAWPANPLDPKSVGLDLYNGMPGVVLFQLELFNATKDPTYLRDAESAADHLLALLPAQGPDSEAGLYTGLAGIAYVLDAVARTTGQKKRREGAAHAFALLTGRAKKVGSTEGIEWNEVSDIIAGSAGIGLTLLDRYRRTGAHDLLESAKAAGRRLIEIGSPEEGGLTWLMSPTFKRNMPNFSHGTAGVSYFLATLYGETHEQAFLDAALAGAKYLQSIATVKDGATTIRHHDGDGKDLYYLSWCHGPVGTARLFYRLSEVTGDDQWLEWLRSLSKGITTSGIPEQRTPGFWNNVGQCCGNTGVSEYFLDLHRIYHDLRSLDFARRVTANTLARATEDGDGIKWIQAENRVEPQNLVAQTGLMQGAAGIGLYFLRLDAFERKKKPSVRLPDSPFA